MKRGLANLALVAALAGCSPSSYQRSADLQVKRLLGDREQSTLGYTPQVEAATDVPIKPTKASYARIPLTPRAPQASTLVEREQIRLPDAPLGPDERLKNPPAAELEANGEQLLQQPLPKSGVLGPPTTREYYRRLDLFGVLEYAVQHSRTYQSQMEDLYLAALGVTLERHLLSPRPFVTQNLNFVSQPSDSERQAALSAATSAGIRQKLPYGGEVAVESLVTFVNALQGNASEGESASLVLSGSVPLLRGAGMVNLEGLISSERELVYQVRAFEDFRRSFVLSTASRYFNLLQQQQGLVNRRLNLANTRSLTERTQALYDASRLRYLEVQRAIQSQISAEASMISAEQAYQDALEDFKLTIGMPIDEMVDVASVELDVNVPVATAEQAVDLALKYRLDLRTASDRVEDARRGVANARNGLLPQLDLTGAARFTNSPDTPARELREDTGVYSAGLSLDLPVDRVAERNAYRRSLISLERAQRAYVNLRDLIISNVRSSLRAIKAAEISVEIQRRGIELAARRLELSNTLLQQGKTDARDVVESQTSLLDAQDAYESARSQLQIRLLEYMRDTGTLRVDPKAGAIGHAMDRAAAPPAGAIP